MLLRNASATSASDSAGTFSRSSSSTWARSSAGTWGVLNQNAFGAQQEQLALNRRELLVDLANIAEIAERALPRGVIAVAVAFEPGRHRET